MNNILIMPFKYFVKIFGVLIIVSFTINAQVKESKQLKNGLVEKDTTSYRVTYIRTFGLDVFGGGSYLLKSDRLRSTSFGYLSQIGLTWLFPINSNRSGLGLTATAQLGALSESYSERYLSNKNYDLYSGGLVTYFGSSEASMMISARAGTIRVGKSKLEEEIFYPSIGWKFWMGENAAFAIEIASVIPFYKKYIKESSVDAKLGFTFFLSSNRDQDYDGVPDNEDLCPNTPPSEIMDVDYFGCSPSQRDSDGDGVMDKFDKCPETPPGVEVDGMGCPVDSDRDGVPDYLDFCPDTPWGWKVDEMGCPHDDDDDGVPNEKDQCPDTPKNEVADEFGCSPSQRDRDRDGIMDTQDNCPDDEETYNFWQDDDGCPDEAPYPYIIEFSSIYPIFDQGSSVISSKVFGDIYVQMISFFEDYPETYWILQVESSELAFERAKSLRDYIDSKFNTAGRLTITSKYFNTTRITLKLDIEKAKEITLNKLKDNRR